MLGIAASTAIKLDPDNAVTLGLTVGEGVETCLAARQLGFRPTWALGSAAAIGTFPVLPVIESLTCLAETDGTGTSEREIESCGSRWRQAGREVIVVTPKMGGDVNDVVVGGL